ncbi:MAG: flavin reductase family protein [Candidatus Odinarchaeia archaeon]
MKSPKKIIKPREALYPDPVILVSSSYKGKDNILTIAWTGMVNSNPPMISISVRPTRYSYNLIKNSGEFVAAIPDSNMILEVDYCGIVSGRNIDKFEAAPLTKGKAEKVAAPLIMECPVNMECKIRFTKLLGSHEVFIGEIVAIHANEDIVDAEGNIDYSKISLITYVNGEYWSLGRKIGVYGFSKNHR